MPRREDVAIAFHDRVARLLVRLGFVFDDHAAGPGATRLQVAALPYRPRDGSFEILLVTSRRSRRWILPKGWPAHGQALHESAAREAWEEAGVRGATDPREIGRFEATKASWSGSASFAPVAVFPLRVERELDDWPERSERVREWFARDAALAAISPEQRAVVAGFAP